MRDRSRVLFSLLIVLLAAWALYATRDWPIKTALYPRVIGVPMLVLAAVELVLSLRGEVPEGAGQAIDVEFTTALPPAVLARRTAIAFAWLLGFFVAVILLGFPIAIPLFAFAYLKAHRESWVMSLALSAAAWTGFYLLFIRLLHLPFAEGLLWRLFIR